MSQFISLDQAKKMTALYRASREEILIESEQGKNVLPVCESLERDKLDTVLAQPGCKGIRIYYGMDDNNLVHSIIVGTDEFGRDLVQAMESGSESESQSDPNYIVDEM